MMTMTKVWVFQGNTFGTEEAFQKAQIDSIEWSTNGCMKIYLMQDENDSGEYPIIVGAYTTRAGAERAANMRVDTYGGKNVGILELIVGQAPSTPKRWHRHYTWKVDE
jgi:hypothetical protein